MLVITEKICQNVIGAEKVMTEGRRKNGSNLSFAALLED